MNLILYFVILGVGAFLSILFILGTSEPFVPCLDDYREEEEEEEEIKDLLRYLGSSLIAILFLVMIVVGISTRKDVETDVLKDYTLVYEIARIDNTSLSSGSSFLLLASSDETYYYYMMVKNDDGSFSYEKAELDSVVIVESNEIEPGLYYREVKIISEINVLFFETRMHRKEKIEYIIIPEGTIIESFDGVVIGE